MSEPQAGVCWGCGAVAPERACSDCQTTYVNARRWARKTAAERQAHLRRLRRTLAMLEALEEGLNPAEATKAARS